MLFNLGCVQDSKREGRREGVGGAEILLICENARERFQIFRNGKRSCALAARFRISLKYQPSAVVK